MTRPCVFCEIVADRLPATVVGNGFDTLLIEPVGPVVDGHVLALPKRHVEDAYEVPSATAQTMQDAAMWAWARSNQDERYWSVNFITSVGRPATQSVFHLHIHIVPRHENDGLALPWYSGRSK